MRLMMIVLLLGLLAVPTRMHAHGTELIGGRVEMHDDGEVLLLLELTPSRLELFTKPTTTGLRTWGDLRLVSSEVDQAFSASLRLRCGDQEWAPTAVQIRPLLGAYPPSDPMRLPDFVPVTVIWKGTPKGPCQVVAHFALPTCNLILVLENSTDVLGVDNGVASNDPTAVALIGMKQPLGDQPSAAAQRNVESWWRTVGRALLLGIAHIIPDGFDHVLFVLGLYLAVRRFRDLLWQVTAFTAAHCLTLGLVMGQVISLRPAWALTVEIGIALSIVAVTVENCVHCDGPGWRRIALATLFGLIHGLGFARALSEVPWPAERFLPALLAANLGIECGQLIVIAAAALVTAWWWNQAWYRWRIVIPASALIGLCGATWAVQRMWLAFV